MTPQQQKDQTEPQVSSFRRTFRIAAHFALSATIMFGGGGLALYSAWNGITFTRTYEGRAEHTFKDGSHRRDDGRGFSFTNPFKVASTTRWELQRHNVYFNSARKEQDRLDVDFSFTFVGPETMNNYSKVQEAAWTAGDNTLKEVFQKNSWTSYAAVDPAAQPANAVAVCDALSKAIRASLGPDMAERITVTDCKIKVDVPFKGYTAKKLG